MANYPLDVTKGPFIHFQAYKTSMRSHFLDFPLTLSKTEILWSCNLYAPGNLQDSVSAIWDADNSVNVFHSLAKKAERGVQVQSIFSSAGGTVTPNEILIFRGSENLSFNVQFKFIPKNEKEANEIQEIIGKFKTYCLPKLTLGKFIMKTPPIWDITIVTNTDKISTRNLIRYEYMALLNVNVTYSEGSSTLLYYRNGLPVDTTLSLSFKCLFPAYSKESDIAQGTPKRD